MTQKAKGPAVRQHMPSQVQSPDKGHKNVETVTTETIVAASEHPEQRLRRLAKEISATLNDFDDQHLVMIFPSKSREYPIQICLDREFADLMQNAIKYLEGAK